jgi:hypothetical protein
MARYKPVDRHLSKLLPVTFSEQIVPGTFEYAVNWLVDHKIDMRVFDGRYRNDDTGAPAFDPAVLLKIRAARLRPRAELLASNRAGVP